VAEDEKRPATLLYPHDPSLDPQLVWKGRDQQDGEPSVGACRHPVFAVMLREMGRYDAVLESHSREVMRHVEYEIHEAGVPAVLNETAPYYRYRDLTRAAEELFGFTRDTIEQEFTAELEYLGVFRAARREPDDIVDMPDSRLDPFIRLSLQGSRGLSWSRRARFAELTNDKVAAMETVVQRALSRAQRDSPPSDLEETS